MARKTVPVETLIQYANGYLSAKGGTQEAREAIISMIEAALMSAGRYQGYKYLGEDEVHESDRPGIRWKEFFDGDGNEQTRHERASRDTDKTRRSYY